MVMNGWRSFCGSFLDVSCFIFTGLDMNDLGISVEKVRFGLVHCLILLNPCYVSAP